MTPLLRKGDAFLIPSGPSGHHMFVVCTGEAPDGSRLLLSISTIREGRYHDPTCVLEPGIHPFVKVPSFVDYSKAEQRHSAHILKCLDAGLFIGQQRVEEAVVARILDGIYNSDRTKNWVFDFLRSLE